MSKAKLLGPFRQILTMSNLSVKGPISNDQLEIIVQGGVLIQGTQISDIGGFIDLKEKYDRLDLEIISMEGDHILLPGFIDAHTHICFAGTRANDFALRNSGSSYLEIAKAGGGIWDTVGKTRMADKAALINGIADRVVKQVSNGITTCEVKSGYGLNVDEEIKMLEAINEANEKASIELIPTCLAAHIFPKDYNGNIEDYINEIVESLFPILKSKGLTNRVDAFIEEEAFNEKVIKPYFDAAQKLGFDITVHADQFSPGGSEIAVNYKAKSADHLEASSDKEIQMLANSNVVSMALPGASLGIGCPFTPARKILDAGGALAIASDWNPGSAPMGDLIAQASILATYEKLTNAEILSGVTFRAAEALGLKDRGRLIKGAKADFLIYNTSSYKEITYNQGQLKPSAVYKNGEKIN